jgi:hypothetical protein
MPKAETTKSPKSSAVKAKKTTEVKVKPKTKKAAEAELRTMKIAAKWQQLYAQSQDSDVKAETYNMKKNYTSQTPINHKVLGWGFILDNKNNRLEVLFKDGVRFLISNYK